MNMIAQMLSHAQDIFDQSEFEEKYYENDAVGTYVLFLDTHS